MKNHSESEFDAFASDYRDILEKNIKNLSEFGSEYFAEYKVQIVKESLNKAPENILDFGCGDGFSCAIIHKYFPSSIIKGIDVSSECVKVAENKKISNASFSCYDGVKLPFKEDSFDVIFVACVFHHIEKQKHVSLINEFKRVLKKDGSLFIFEHNPLNPFTQKVVRNCIFDIDAKLIWPNSFKKMVQKADFKEVKINYTLFFPRYHIFKKFFPIEKNLTSFPFGAQYYLEATKFN